MQYRILKLSANALLIAGLHIGAAQADEPRCAEPVATLVSLEGLVEASDNEVAAWRPVSTATRFCPGDRLRVGANSRAAVVLSNHTVMRLDALSTLNFTGPQEQGSLWVELLRGVSHFISRVPRRLNVSTPYVNAGVEGTEFLVTADDRESSITVFEGRVNAGNPQGSLLLTSGQSATATSGSAPVLRVLIKPRDGLHWALHYPSIIQFSAADFEDKDEADWLTQVAQSLTALGRGDRAGALAAVEQLGDGITDARFFTYRASLYLGVGRADAAERDIEQALQLDGANGNALALQAVIALAQNDKDRGLHLAMQAVDKAPHAAGAHLALSYAWQAQFELELARAAAQEAVKIDPHDALAWARLAELHLMFGEPDAAIAAAEEAARLDPRLARSQSVLGFAYLNDIRLGDARQAFEQAAMLDPSDPLPRLGLGLIQVREGELESGRQQMEIAASLDPDDALVRSYLGKAYYEENRDARAASQFDIAKALDPNDPTPWFYDAILKQSAGRPVEALHDLETSIALNDNRAVYRSRLLLDEDAAARGASLARIYQNLGFEMPAQRQAAASLIIDPSNHSAHRFLADSYIKQPRHEIARASELLQAQLFQPVGLNPVQPRLNEFSLRSASSSVGSAAFNEFTPLIIRDKLYLSALASAGNHNTFSDEITLAGVEKKLAYSLGQLHYTTDGFRDNANVQHNIYNAFAQMQLTDKLDGQVEVRRRETDQGDLDLSFNPSDISPNLSQRIKQDTTRLGIRFTPAPGKQWILSLVQDKLNETFDMHDPGATVISNNRQQGIDAEAQYIHREDFINLIIGAGGATIDESHFGFQEFADGGGHPPQNTDFTNRQRNAYAYANLTLRQNLVTTFGVSYDSVYNGLLNRDEINPKLGVQWNMTRILTLRAASFETTKRIFATNRTIEPTQVGGFNQFFDDFNGATTKFHGLGLDAAMSRSLFTGIEYSNRDVKTPLEIHIPFEFIEDKNQEEKTTRAYLNWMPHSEWALTLEVQNQRMMTSIIPFTLRTRHIPITLRYFHPRGLFTIFSLHYLHQKIDYDSPDTLRKDQAVLADVSLGYKFPKRRGSIKIEIANVFDEKFNFQDLSFFHASPYDANPQFIPARTIATTFILNL